MRWEFFPVPTSCLQTVNPFLVESSMTANMKYRKTIMNSEDYARQALDTLGLTSQTSGCLTHAVQVPPWGNYGQRAGRDTPWPRSTSPPSEVRRCAEEGRASTLGWRDRRRDGGGEPPGGVYPDSWSFFFPEFPAGSPPAQLVFSQSLGSQVFISVDQFCCKGKAL